MNAEQMKVGMVLIPDNNAPVECRMGSAIQCLEVSPKGFKFRRMHLSYNLEEFFMSTQMLEGSLWMIAPDNSQLRFL